MPTTQRVCIALLATGTILAAGQAARAAEVIHTGAVYRTGGHLGGGVYDGFPDFMTTADTNATTRAWNLYGSDQTLNGVLVRGTGSANSGATGLTIIGSPNSYYSGFLNWSGDPQQTAKNDISRRGRWSPSTSSWSVDITAVPGTSYDVQLLSNPVSGGNNRTLDVTVDGTLFADNLYVPGNNPHSVVYKFPVTADADGIDITFSGGDQYDANPWVTAIAVTETVPSYSGTVIADNPHGYWRLGESSGLVAVDSSGPPPNGNYGHFSPPDGLPTLGAAGIPGGGGDTAVEFPGPTAVSQVYVADGVDPTAYTLEAWVKVDPGATASRGLITRTASNPFTTWSHQLRINAAGQFEHYLFDGGGKAVADTAAVQPDQWYHVVGTAQNGGQMTLYVDGSPVGSRSMGNLWTGGNQWRFAAPSGDGMNWFDGVMDEVAIYHNVLTPQQILAHYQAGITAPTVIPEPITMLAVGLSIAGLGGYVRRRRA